MLLAGKSYKQSLKLSIGFKCTDQRFIIINQGKMNLESKKQTAEVVVPIPSFTYQLDHYNTLRKFYAESRFSDASQPETFHERALQGDCAAPQKQVSNHLPYQSKRRESDSVRSEQQDIHEIIEVTIPQESKQIQLGSSCRKDLANQAIQMKRFSYFPNLQSNNYQNELKMQPQIRQAIKPAFLEPFLNQKSGLQSIKSQYYSNQSMKQEATWKFQRSDHQAYLDKSNQSSSAGVSKRSKAKRQEISTRFQSLENRDDYDRTLEQLHAKLFNPEFNDLLQNNPDFYDYCFEITGKKLELQAAKIQNTKSNYHSSPQVKDELYSNINCRQNYEGKLKEQTHAHQEQEHNSNGNLSEINEWSLRQSDYPVKPRYEFKLADLPEEDYEYMDKPDEDDDHFFFKENGLMF